MKQTVWEINYDNTRLRYDHHAEQIFIEQELNIHGTVRKAQIELSADEVSNLGDAVGELMQMLKEVSNE